MDRDILKNGGFNLIELSLVFAIAAMLLGAVFCSAARTRRIALAGRTIQEMDALASASTQYYLGIGAWPQDVADLRPAHLSPEATGINPFGNVYTIAGGVSSVTISTALPKGLITPENSGSEIVIQNQGANDLVSVTRSVESTAWGLQHDKKNIFHQ